MPKLTFLVANMALLTSGLLNFASASALAADLTLGEAIAAVQKVDKKGQGHADAVAAMNTLSAAPKDEICTVLEGMNDAGPLAMNWLRAAVESIAGNADVVPVEDLTKFLNDNSNSPRARRLAYELIVTAKPELKTALVIARLDDSSLELRRDAVALVLKDADEAKEAKNVEKAKGDFRTALFYARDLDQIKLAAKELEDLGEKVDLATVFGFVMRWQVVGPFDHTGSTKFDFAYGPEKDPAAETYTGRKGEEKWQSVETDDQFGLVDLNKILGNEKGAIAYCETEFLVKEPTEAEIRLGCINANKIWVNGELITANEVYHAGSDIDQYVGKCKLKAGKNVILLKICQNEQTEQWAQKWEFQLRVCDELGTAILSTDRPVEKTVSK